MADVGDRVLHRERGQVELGADPLGEGPVGAVPEPLAQLGLPHEHDRDQVAVVELEVREQADLLESGLARDEVGFVDDQERRSPLPVQLQEPCVDLVEQVARVEARLSHPQLARHRAQELAGREARVQDHPDLVALAQAVDEGAGEEGLAAAHLAGQERQLHLLGREDQALEGLLVALVEEEVARVRRQLERPLLESVKAFVHRGDQLTKS